MIGVRNDTLDCFAGSQRRRLTKDGVAIRIASCARKDDKQTV